LATSRGAASWKVERTDHHRWPSASSDNASTLVQAFSDRIVEGTQEMSHLNPAEVELIGVSAANEALASLRWSQILGDRIDTTEASQLLGVTRQALAKRQAAGSLLGLPGQGTTWYPKWQFNVALRKIRPEAAEIIGAFRENLEVIDPLTIASWAVQEQPEDLEGLTPADWVQKGGDRQRVRVAAERAASRLAR
jgi:hypothetical protein